MILSIFGNSSNSCLFTKKTSQKYFWDVGVDEDQLMKMACVLKWNGRRCSITCDKEMTTLSSRRIDERRILSYTFSNLSIQYHEPLRHVHFIRYDVRIVYCLYFGVFFYEPLFFSNKSLTQCEVETSKCMQNMSQSRMNECNASKNWFGSPSLYSTDELNELLNSYVRYQVTMHRNNRMWRVFVSQFSHHFNVHLYIFFLYFFLLRSVFVLYFQLNAPTEEEVQARRYPAKINVKILNNKCTS